MRTSLLISMLAACALSTAAAADKGGNRGNGHGNKRGGQYEDRGRYRGGGDDRYGDRDFDRGCPPGLAKKHNGCQPPGQARFAYGRGQYLPRGYSNYTDYRDLPDRCRSRVRYGDQYRYVYRGDRVYVVDRTTRLIRDIVDLLR